jgi:hypothetical protein
VYRVVTAAYSVFTPYIVVTLLAGVSCCWTGCIVCLLVTRVIGEGVDLCWRKRGKEGGGGVLLKERQSRKRD